MLCLSSKKIINKSANLNIDISIFQHKDIFQLSNSHLFKPINCLCLEFMFASNRVFQLLIIYNIMYKKMERSNYALPSSVMADFPLSIGKAESQILSRGQATQMKQSSSIFNAFNQSRSRAEENINLQYSTAKPFYGELAQEYYEDNEMGEKHIYNIQQKEHYIMERVKQKKSPNKRLMVYSYSNIMVLHGKIDKILLEQKKRTFMMLYRVKKEDRAYLYYGNNKNANFNRGQTYKRSQEDALYRVSLASQRQDRFVLYQKKSKGVNIISGWFQYRVLLDKRKALNTIFQYGNDRKKFSLELSQSLRVENAHNYNNNLTDYQHSNQISLTNGLPQQIQESLVYTLEHNGQSTRKEITQSTLQRFPTLKNYPSYVQVKQKGSYHQIQNQNSKKSSPMNKLNSFSGSYASPKPDIKIIAPLKLQLGMLKNKKINIDGFVDFPLEIQQMQYQEQNNINDHQQVIQYNIIKHNISVNDDIQTNNFDNQLKKIQTTSSNQQQTSRRIQSSAKYSDVSNYQMENTVQRQQRTYQVIVNYVTNNHQPVIQDQTVHRKQAIVPIIQKNTNSKIERYYVIGEQQNPPISTPKFTSEIQMNQRAPKFRISQEKLVSQLDNDRIRIFGNNSHQPIKQASVMPQRLTRLRANFSPQPPSFVSNNAIPISISPQKRILSPKIQTEQKLVNKILPNQIFLQPSSQRNPRQHIKVETISPDYHNQSPVIQIPKNQARIIKQPIVHINQKGQPQYQIPYHKPVLSPQILKTPNNILAQNPVLVRKQMPINQTRIISPLRRLNQKRQIFSKQKVPNDIQRKHQQYIHNTPQQNIQYPVIKRINPTQNHIIHVQQQYQLPQTQIKTLKIQNHAPQQIFIRQNALMNDLYVTQNKQKYDSKRPQSYASSPKLFFNYNSHNQSHVDQQIIVSSHHITKNSSSLSRPKSMNSKLFVTLKKEF